MLQITLAFALLAPSADPDAAAALALAQAGTKSASKAICGPVCTACDCATTGVCTCDGPAPGYWRWEPSEGGYWWTWKDKSKGTWKRWKDSTAVVAAPPVPTPAINYVSQPVHTPVPVYQPVYQPAYVPQPNYGTSDYGAAGVYSQPVHSPFTPQSYGVPAAYMPAFTQGGCANGQCDRR